MVWLAGLMLGWLVPDLLAAGLADLLADLLAGWPERNQGLTWLAWVAGRVRADLWSGLAAWPADLASWSSGPLAGPVWGAKTTSKSQHTVGAEYGKVILKQLLLGQSGAPKPPANRSTPWGRSMGR